MNIQSSSFARLETGNPGRSENENSWSVREPLKKVYEKLKSFDIWRKKVVFATCVFALAIDPLFLFVPEINFKETCFTFNKTLGGIVCGLRTIIDTVYWIQIIFWFIENVIDYLDRSHENSLRGELIVVYKAVRKRIIHWIVDIASVLPIPQAVVLSLIIGSSSNSWVSKRRLIRWTKWIIVVQYIPRIIRIYPLYKEVTRTSGTIAESNWAGAALNLFLFLMCSYVFGAFWYVNGVQKQNKCWRNACRKTSGCNFTKDMYCAKGVNNSRFLNTSCPLIDPDEIANSSTHSSVYNFGMYIEVLKSGVAEVEPREFTRRFVYCFWWGLRNLSTFAQNLKPGNSATDIFFAIVICVSGLFLFAVLIGNVQKYMISSTVRVEEMKERKRDTEKWMSFRELPDPLKERIRKYNTYKWRGLRGTEEDSLLRCLPKDLRLETKRHLYKDLLQHAPLLEIMNEWQLEAVCDRVKSVFYSANSEIVREGDPVEEMLIVMKGRLECKTKSSEKADHSNTSELEEGDVCGDLHFWIFNPTPSHHLPTSDKTVTTLTNVEGFILLPDDLNFVASRLDPGQSQKVKEMFRSLSEQQLSECSSSSHFQK